VFDILDRTSLCIKEDTSSFCNNKYLCTGSYNTHDDDESVWDNINGNDHDGDDLNDDDVNDNNIDDGSVEINDNDDYSDHNDDAKTLKICIIYVNIMKT